MREVKWVFSFIRGKNIAWMILAWLAGIASVVLLIVEPKIISHIVDNILKPMFADSSVPTKEVLDQVVPLLLIALAVVITRAVLKFWANVERDEVAYRALLILREDLYEKIGAQSRTFFMKNRSGDLINKCTGDVDAINHFIGWVSFAIFDSVVMLVIVLTVFFSISWKFTLIQLCLAPISFIVANKLGKSVRPLFVQARLQLSKLNTVVNENISGNRVVDLYARIKCDFINLEPDFLSILIGINDAWHRHSHKIATTDAQIELNYRCILERMKNETNAKIVILAPFYLDCPDNAYLKEDLKTLLPIVRTLAKEYADVYIPLDEIFAEAMKTQPEPLYYSGDGVHPNANGARFIGEHYARAIEKLL